AARDLDELVDREIALGGRGWPDGVRLVGETYVERIAVRIAVHRHGGHPEIAAGTDDADRDLAAVRDEDLAEGGRQLTTARLRPIAVAARRRRPSGRTRRRSIRGRRRGTRAFVGRRRPAPASSRSACTSRGS